MSEPSLGMSESRFDAKALEELAATFKAQGVLEPLLVRELEERAYQVVIGARRLRAAKIAELDAVPVRVVKLSDAEAIEAQVVELSVVGKGFRCQYAVRHVVCI
jgi:ParB family chromosome partitioning protein